MNIKLFIPSGYGLRWSPAAFAKDFHVLSKAFIEIKPLWAVLILYYFLWIGLVLYMVFLLASKNLEMGWDILLQ